MVHKYKKIYLANTVICSHLLPDPLKALEAFACQHEICLASQLQYLSTSKHIKL